MASCELEELFEERRMYLNLGWREMAKEATRRIRRLRREEKRKEQLCRIDEQMDIRDTWMGLRSMKKDFVPLAYSRRDDKGDLVDQDGVAEASATPS
eukprot:2916128-Prorocentrum_lima.AAC.1